MVDEAYFEFSRRTIRPLIDKHANLVVLRTFSKAFSLAGVRMGYILSNSDVVNEFVKVRQPYSVDAVSQVVARVVFENRAQFERGVVSIIERARARHGERFAQRRRHRVPLSSNWILFKVDQADQVWARLYDQGVLVRDFSRTPMLEGTLRVTIGTREENDAFLAALRSIVFDLRQ